MMTKMLWGSVLLTSMACPITAALKHDAVNKTTWVESTKVSSVPNLLQAAALNEAELRWYAQADLDVLKDYLSLLLGQSVDTQPRLYIGSFQTPLDYHNQANKIKIGLNYLIHYAKDQPEDKPTLWLHYGVPGYSTLIEYVFDDMNSVSWSEAAKYRARALKNNDPFAYDHFRDFNVVILEARMTGYSGLSNLFNESSPQFEDLQLSEATAKTQIHRLGRYYSTNTYVEDIERLRQWLAQGTAERIALKTDKIHLLGMAYGARAYAYYAHQYPEHVASLILDSVPALANTPPATLIQFSRELAGIPDDVPLQNSAYTGTAARVHISCSDLGYVQVLAPIHQNDQIGTTFYDQWACQDIRRDPLANLANSVTLKQLHFPVLLFSNRQDSTTPLPLQQQVFDQVFARQGLHIIYDEDDVYPHANLRDLLAERPIRQQIFNYMLQPNAILDHMAAFADHACDHQSNLDQVEETRCLPAVQAR